MSKHLQYDIKISTDQGEKWIRLNMPHLRESANITLTRQQLALRITYSGVYAV